MAKRLSFANTAPKIVPSKMAKKVPASTKALPCNSSFLFKLCGKILYFIGPKKVDCAPIKNNTNNSQGTDCRYKPIAPSIINKISIILIRLINKLFSYFSASCPARGENIKNGKINSMAATLTNVSLLALLKTR